eukprot:2021822-Pleurochrysis_carterae.AAC.3
MAIETSRERRQSGRGNTMGSPCARAVSIKRPCAHRPFACAAGLSAASVHEARVHLAQHQLRTESDCAASCARGRLS